MATAAEKRAWVSQFAKKFEQKMVNWIYEGPVDNTGPLLDKWLKRENASPHADLAWCASFVSALSYWTDKHFNFEGPKRKYNSASSQHVGAGLFSTNVKEAVPGVAISWKNITKSGGHVALVINVSDKGITTIEGNTGTTVVPQDRNGGVSKMKTYTWAQVAKPFSTRKFNAYYKIWDEDTNEMKKDLPNIDFDDSALKAEMNKNIQPNLKQETKTTSAASVQNNVSNYSDEIVDIKIYTINNITLKENDVNRTSKNMIPIEKILIDKK